MGADCLGNQYRARDSIAKKTGAIPINPKFEGKSSDSAMYGDKTPAQAEDNPTKTGW